MSQGPKIDKFVRHVGRACVHRFFLLFLLIFLGMQSAIAQVIFAKDGVLNAASHALEENSSFELSGEWQVVWGKLLLPEEFEEHYDGELFVIPQRWSESHSSALSGAQGVATFRLRFSFETPIENLSYHMISPHSAWRLFENEELLGGNGVVASDKSEFVAGYASRVFDAKGGEVSLILQVANFSHAHGGPGHPISVWESNSLDQLLDALSVYYTLVLGVLLAIAMFHAIFYLADRHHREQGPVHIWFSLLCLILVIRIGNVVPYYAQYFPDAAYWASLRISYWTLFAAPGVYLLFFRAAFPKHFPSKVTIATAVACFALSMVVLLTNEVVYTRIRNLAIAANVASIIFSIICVALAWRDRERGAAVILIANALFFVTAISDTLLYTEQSNGFDLTPFGFLLVGLGYSYALLLRLQQTFDEARKTSKALESLNRELEAKVHDRTRAFEAAAAKAQNSAHERAQFIAAASHDLRQPLHALAMFTNALKQKESSEEFRELVNLQEESISNLSDLLQGTLDTARVDIEQKQPKMRSFVVVDALSKVELDYSIQAKKRGIEFSTSCELGDIHTDPVMLQRVLGNLVDNALKAAKSGVKLEAIKIDKAWIFSVKDDGSGIEKGDASRIFQSYVSLDERSASGGYGLGLYVVKEFANALGGTVTVESGENRGSVFSVSIPIGELAEAQTQYKMPPAEAMRSLQGLHVLTIDDEPQVLKAMQSMLSTWGCTVLTAETEEQALLVIESSPEPDAVLIDFHLFETDGLKVASTLRGILAPETPIIIISGATEPTILRSVRQVGLSFMEKPIDPAVLAQELAQI
ncbi:MAG: ATP-binding protein [Pseudomonadales bacterium]